MTDKQIIIDGINVSGCKYYLFREQQPKGERCCGMGLVDCNNNDCLYKKYKRKEQECERLMSTLADIKEIIHFNKTNRLSGGADISIEQILQKISEVEDE